MQYKVIQGESKYDFEKEVTKHLDEGWKLQGSVCYSRVEGFGWLIAYCQAMVKEK